MGNNRSVFESLFNGVADAVADIREKVVEEPWFGRVVTERGDAAEWPQAMDVGLSAPDGLSGDILGPEPQPMYSHESGGLLEHGWVIDAQPMSREASPSPWAQATQALTYQPEHEQNKDIDIDR